MLMMIFLILDTEDSSNIRALELQNAGSLLQDLQALYALHTSGGLSDEEYTNAKKLHIG